MSYDRFLSQYPLPGHCRQSKSHLPIQCHPRRRTWVVLIAFVGSLIAIAGLAHGAAPFRPLDAVVQVKTVEGNGGSGVVISPDGRVLTAEHIVGFGTVSKVIYRGVSYPAEALHAPEKNGRDEAVLVKFDRGGPVNHLPIATTPPRPGDVVYSCGYPALTYYAANIGEVTEILSSGEIRVNFWVIEGNSGGPLLNANSEVIGLASTRDDLPGARDRSGKLVENIQPGSTWIGLDSIQTAVSQKPSTAKKPLAKPEELLYFSSRFCGPCRQMAPVIDKLKKEGYPIQKIDVEEQPRLTRRYRIRSVPSYVLLQDGQEFSRFSGLISEKSLRELLGKPQSENLEFGPEPYRRPANYEMARIEDLFKNDPPPKPPRDAEKFPEPDTPEIDWSLVKIVVLRSNPNLSDNTAAVIAALQDRLGGPFRRRLLELTKGRADIELVHQQATPTKFDAVQAVLGREAGKLLVVVMVKQQDLGFIKGQIVSQIQSSLAGYIDGTVPVEVVSERVHPGDYIALEAALETPESAEVTDNRPWWIAGLSTVIGMILAYVTSLIKKRKAATE